MQLAPDNQNNPLESLERAATAGAPTLAIAYLSASGRVDYAAPDPLDDPIGRDPSNRGRQDQQNYLLRMAINQIPQAVAMFSADEKLIVCNDAFRGLYALPARLCAESASFWEILGQGAAFGLVPVDSRGTDFARIREIVRAGRAWRGMMRISDGRIISTIHEPLDNGGWISMQEDVTEQHLREKAEMAQLREAEAESMRFSAAINNMNQGLAMFDAARKLVVCNQSFARLYNLPPQMMRPGTPFADIFRHRYHLGLTGRDEDFQTGYANIGELIDNRRGANGPVTMRTGQVFMVSHQPLSDGGWLSTHEDVTEQHRNAEIIRYLARHDSLTGLANRSTFLEAMTDAEARIDDGDILAVICLDLDRFKQVNDSLGHAIGDAVLTGVSGRLLSVLEGHGLVARLGGDEFAALVGPLESPAEAMEIVEMLMERLAEPLTVGNSTVSCAASCGIALAPQHGHDAHTLMRCADLALYRAKADTPGSFSLFETRMDVAQRRRQAIEAGLRTAIGNTSVSLMYQPIIALESGRVCCCEALMRWRSPELGMVSPAEFISVAEETGQIRDLGVWALETACMEATGWPCHVRVAVNVSPVQFHGHGLVGEVRRALALSGLEPSRLELEITESLFLADDAHNLEVLHQLRELGVRVALDDFGTGYSSLAYMLRFPFDKVKIDRAIVSTIAEKPETVAMVTAIVELCRGFNMPTVAEGIETEEQLEQVRAHGCDEVQGYIFSPPLPQSAIGELLRGKQMPAMTAVLQRHRA